MARASLFVSKTFYVTKKERKGFFLVLNVIELEEGWPESIDLPCVDSLHLTLDSLHSNCMHLDKCMHLYGCIFTCILHVLCIAFKCVDLNAI